MMESTVIREDASTESRLLLKQMCGSFGSKTKKGGGKYTNKTQIKVELYVEWDRNFPVFVTGSLRSLF